MDFVDAYEKGLGIDIFAMSGWNEPDVLSSMGGWASCSWSVDQMAKFVLENLRPEMNKRGHSDMKLVYGENAWWSWATKHINSSLEKYPELADPNLIVAGHGYSTTDARSGKA